MYIILALSLLRHYVLFNIPILKDRGSKVSFQHANIGWVYIQIRIYFYLENT